MFQTLSLLLFNHSLQEKEIKFIVFKSISGSSFSCYLAFNAARIVGPPCLKQFSFVPLFDTALIGTSCLIQLKYNCLIQLHWVPLVWYSSNRSHLFDTSTIGPPYWTQLTHSVTKMYIWNFAKDFNVIQGNSR